MNGDRELYQRILKDCMPINDSVEQAERDARERFTDVVIARHRESPKRMNIFSCFLLVVGIALCLFHIAMGYGPGDYGYVGLSGVFCICLGIAISYVFD